MKTNSKVQNVSLKKVLLFTALIFGASSFSQASTSNQNLEEINIKIEINGLKELPSITLVDKDLRIIAEFYGDSSEVKEQFETTFKNAEILSKHNNRSIYLILSK